MTDTEIIERYFLARRWEQSKNGLVGNVVVKSGDWLADFPDIYTELPQILTDFPAFKEHVLEVMGEEGYGYYINYIDSKLDWYWVSEILTCVGEEIKDNNILHAAVIGATRYWEEK